MEQADRDCSSILSSVQAKLRMMTALMTELQATIDANPTKFDVVFLGETMLRFSPDNILRLEQAQSLQVHVGGSESNSAVGLARLGKRTAWISRLTNNQLGRRIEQTIAAHGVDTNNVVWTNEDRVGMYFLESGVPPRNSQVIYDRANSAYSKLRFEDLPADIFIPGKSKWLHVTGISLWLGETTRSLIADSVSRAKSAGWQISFDVNYRALLCDAAKASTFCKDLFETADLVFLPKRDAIQLWQMNAKESDDAIMSQLIKIRNGKVTVMTLGARGAIACNATQCVTQSIDPVDPIGRLGGGDAFSAGFLSAWLEQPDLKRSLMWATAMARLKYSIVGDLPLVSRSEVESLVNGLAEGSLLR